MSENKVIDRFRFLETKVRKYFEQAFGFEFPPVQYVSVPLEVGGLVVGVGGPKPDMRYIRSRLAEAKERVCRRYGRYFQIRDGGDCFKRFRDSETKIDLRSIGPDKWAEGFPENTVFVSPDIYPGDHEKHLAHEFFHLMLGLKGISTRHIPCEEGVTNYFIGRCFGRGRKDLGRRRGFIMRNIALNAIETRTSAIKLADFGVWVTCSLVFASKMLDRLPLKQRLAALVDERFYERLDSLAYYSYQQERLRYMIGISGLFKAFRELVEDVRANPSLRAD